MGGYTERSSGVVLDVIFNGTPVIGKKCQALSFIEENRIGCLFDDINSFDFSKLLNIIHYKQYEGNIIAYKNTHCWYGSKLKKFIGL